MNQKFFYKIGLFFVIATLLLNIAIKASIWPSAATEANKTQKYRIKLFRNTGKIRYTTKLREDVFHGVDKLLSPAFLIIFVMFTVRLLDNKDLLEIEN